MRRAPADAGFLLAETLITFALSALVLVGLASSTAVLLRATDRSVAAVGSADDLGRTLAALTRDVSQLKRARWSGDEPQDFVFRGGPNSLFFAQEVPVAGGGRDLRVVSLREIAGEHGVTLLRAEAHLPATAGSWGDLRFGPGRAVATGPARLRFRYIGQSASDGRTPPPVDIWASGPTLPAVVVVEAVQPGSTRLLATDRIAVRADADIGCADRTLPREPAGAPSGTPGAAPQPARASRGDFSINDAAAVANPNEFCGRPDKGLAPKGTAGPRIGVPSLAEGRP